MGAAFLCQNLNRRETMKNLITTTLTLFTTSLLLAGCYGGGGSDQTSQQRLQQAQQQLMQQQASTSHWQLAAGILAVSCLLLFFTGTILGSRTRRNAKRPDSREEQ